MVTKDWSFDNLDFDKHVRGQLPWYGLATDLVAFLVRQYLPTSGGRLYDIGASTGNITHAIRDLIEERDAIAISIEQNPKFKDEFLGVGDFVVADAVTYDYKPYDVAVLFLAVMFIPVPQREALFTQLKQNLRAGGAIIIVDKVSDSAGYIATCLKRITIAFKDANISKMELITKELSLAGVQRPTVRNGELFFKFGEFEGWIIEG